MPGKSKHGKGKRYQQIKKAKYLQRQGAVAAPAPAAAAAPQASAPVQAVKAVKAAAVTATAKASQYTYITGDLRHIGILTSIIIVILFVLYFILR